MMQYGHAGFERRVFPRFRVNLPIAYQREAGTPLASRTGNVSQGGLLLFLDEAVAPGERLRIQLHLTDRHASHKVEAVGRIIWAKVSPDPQSGGGAYQAGFVFEEMSAEHKKILRTFETIWLEQGRQERN